MAGPVKENLNDWYTRKDSTTTSGINGGTVLYKNPDINEVRGSRGTKESPYAKYLPGYDWGAVPEGSDVLGGNGYFYKDPKTETVTNIATGKTYREGDYNDYTLRHPEDEEGITEEQLAKIEAIKKFNKENPKVFSAGFKGKGGELKINYFDSKGRRIYKGQEGLDTDALTLERLAMVPQNATGMNNLLSNGLTVSETYPEYENLKQRASMKTLRTPEEEQAAKEEAEATGAFYRPSFRQGELHPVQTSVTPDMIENIKGYFMSLFQ